MKPETAAKGTPRQQHLRLSRGWCWPGGREGGNEL